MSVRGAEAARQYDEMSREASRIVGRYTQLKNRLAAERDKVSAQLEESRAALAAIYLPALDAASLESAATLTGFRGFARRDPIAAMEKEAHQLRARIAKIVADERYQRRTFLVGPVGEYTRALAEAEELLEPWQAECQKFESLEGFVALYTQKYDSPDYEVRWWEPVYWRNWALGDEICEALGMDDFGDDVRPAYEKVKAPRDRWLEQVRLAQEKVDAVHGLVQAHDQSVARLQQLPRVYLAESRQVLARHLSLADPTLLAEWAGDDRGIIMGLRKAGGLQAKLDFLDDAIDRGIAHFIRDMDARRSKYARKATKYRRPKHHSRMLMPRELDRKFPTKVPKYLANAEKLELIAERVVAYDRYERFELENPPELWFHEFTGGKKPSRLTPSLRGWYDRNPGRTPRRDAQQNTGRLAAAAPAADRLEELGYLS